MIRFMRNETSFGLEYLLAMVQYHQWISVDKSKLVNR